LLSLGVLSSPYDARAPAFCRRQKAAPAFHFKAVSPAGVAIPPGPVRMLPVGNDEVERDDQFFLSVSVSPHSALTAASASWKSSSGPRSINDSAVAGAPSISRPRTSSSPHSR